jgi:heme exporter protein B
MRLARQAWLLALNDLRQELRRFELVLTAGFFALVVLVMFALSFHGLDDETQVKAVPGMLWLSLAFVGALTLTRVFDRERESATLGALLAAPVERLSIYFAKLAITVVVLMICGAVLVPALVFAFPGAAPFAEYPGRSLAMLFVGSLGYASIGTLFAAGLAGHGGKNVLLSVILYPLTTPILLYALVAARRLLEGHPDTWATIRQMAALDLAMIAVAAFLFESVLVGATKGRKSSARARADRARKEV